MFNRSKRARTSTVSAVLGVLIVGVVAWGVVHQRRATHAPSAVATAATPSSEHAVLIHLRLSDSAFGTPDEIEHLQALEVELEDAIARAGVGELDGNEIGGGEYVIYTYGPDADRLFGVVEPLLRASSSAREGFVLKRYGGPEDPRVRAVRVDL